MNENLDWNQVPAAIWRSASQRLRPVRHLDSVTLDELIGIDDQKARLVHNTERFLAGRGANNALLWGARGTGKSSLIKALLNDYRRLGLRVIQVDKDDLLYLPEIVDQIRDDPHRFIIYCDELSFEAGEAGYKGLKSVLEGSIETPPDNVLVYATSNRRHLLPEYMSDNAQAHMVEGELHPGEVIDEKISLSDRFGLWLSFYPFTQEAYLRVVDHYFRDWTGDRSELHRAALRFALERGVRSGRTAWQFFRTYEVMQE